ncbi:patatin-like phospholipase family protein [Roseomonas sp. SSH11]|uniref:Patatin-like phospholipase family protein n=1 Tax=Pararoseomonas baculiformis TaxID=2820812 RepID=A0ABS4AE60_9PROT|nr:patatin-like phospholipase family protein [Pararoseomonas baculiformis]MBP0445278.1 patatin-like phospholipase family protein [Pararoseomonas baculiformis]
MTALVLSGGIGLGAFGAGVYAGLEEHGEAEWLLGASAGAVNAAIIGGNPPGRRAAALRRFWSSISADPTPLTSFWLGKPPTRGAWRRAHNEAAALQSLLLGRPGLFRSRLSTPRTSEPPALYDLEPLRRVLPEHLDFDLLNSPGAPRVTLVATDVLSGERVVFDTARGTRITVEHILASGALMPLFAPVEIEGRLLCDGGLASNAPLDLLLDEVPRRPVRCVIAEQFCRAGSRPRNLLAAASRAGDLAFGNQTWRMVEACIREFRLRGLLTQLAGALPPAMQEDPAVAPLLGGAAAEAREMTLLVLGYRADPDEAGLIKPFDFSEVTLAERWDAGQAALREGLAQLASPDGGTRPAPGLTLLELQAPYSAALEVVPG